MNSPGLALATRGPILLITLGLLLAANRVGEYELLQTWPTLIIVFGVMKLFERISSGRTYRGRTES